MLLQISFYWIIFMVLLVFIVNPPENLPPWRFFGAVISLTLLLLLNMVWMNPDTKAFRKEDVFQERAFLLVSVVLVLVAVGLSGHNSPVYLLFAVCSQAILIRGLWPEGTLFTFGILIVWFVFHLALGDSLPEALSTEVDLITGLLYVLLVTILVERYWRQNRQMQSLLKELQEANLELEAAQQQEKELAVAEERVRLAREIHDGLGHHLTVLSIQLQAADKLVGRNPQAAVEAIQICRSEAQAALGEVRTSVAMLRHAPVENRPLAETLDSLVKRFGRSTGMDAQFLCEGTAVDLAPDLRQTVYRAAQEGLTNAQKHGENVQRILVHLVYQPDRVHVTVWDNGQKSDGECGSTSQGYGLAGLKERAEELGGFFQSGFVETGGYQIELSVPLQGEKA